MPLGYYPQLSGYSGQLYYSTPVYTTGTTAYPYPYLTTASANVIYPINITTANVGLAPTGTTFASQGTFANPGYFVPTWWQAPPETPALRAERKRQTRLDDRAAARAKALLLEHLDDIQRAEYEENRYFHVIGQSGKVYRLKHGIAGNIYELGLDGNELHKFCVHFRDQLPAEDHMLGQLLRLKYDEEALMAIANKHY